MTPPEKPTQMTESQLAGAAGAALAIPTALVYVKYGRKPSQELWGRVRKKLMKRSTRKRLRRIFQ